MAINSITFTTKTLSAPNDGYVQESYRDKIGILRGVLTNEYSFTETGAFEFTVNEGMIGIQGRYIENGVTTVAIDVPAGADERGYLIVRIDLSQSAGNEATLTFKQGTQSGFPVLQQQDFKEFPSSGVYEFRLNSYTVSGSGIVSSTDTRVFVETQTEASEISYNDPEAEVDNVQDALNALQDAVVQDAIDVPYDDPLSPSQSDNVQEALDERAMHNQVTLANYGIDDADYLGLTQSEATNLVGSQLVDGGGRAELICYEHLTSATYPNLRNALGFGSGFFKVRLSAPVNNNNNFSAQYDFTGNDFMWTSRKGGTFPAEDWFRSGGVVDAVNVNYDDPKSFSSDVQDALERRGLHSQNLLFDYDIIDSEFSGLSRADATAKIVTRLNEEGGSQAMCYQLINTTSYVNLFNALDIGSGQFSVKLHTTNAAYFRMARSDGVTLDARVNSGNLVKDWYISGGTIHLDVNIPPSGGVYTNDILRFANAVTLETDDFPTNTRPSLTLHKNNETVTVFNHDGRRMVANWEDDNIEYETSSTDNIVRIILS